MKFSRWVVLWWFVNLVELFVYIVYKKFVIFLLKEIKYLFCCWILWFKLFYISFFCEWFVNEVSLFIVWWKFFDVRWILNDVLWFFLCCYCVVLFMCGKEILKKVINIYWKWFSRVFLIDWLFEFCVLLGVFNGCDLEFLFKFVFIILESSLNV